MARVVAPAVVVPLVGVPVAVDAAVVAPVDVVVAAAPERMPGTYRNNTAHTPVYVLLENCMLDKLTCLVPPVGAIDRKPISNF